MRALISLAMFTLAGSVHAQEIKITGPLAGASVDPGPAHRALAAGGNLPPRGGGAHLRARPWRAFAFDVLGEVRTDRSVPLVARLGVLQPLPARHDLLFALGPTVQLQKERTAVGAELAVGIESLAGWWTLRAEIAASIVTATDYRDEQLTFRIGLLNVFGRRLWD